MCIKILRWWRSFVKILYKKRVKRSSIANKREILILNTHTRRVNSLEEDEGPSTFIRV